MNCPHCQHEIDLASVEPYEVPDTAAELLDAFEQTQPPSSPLLDALRDFTALPLPAEAGHVKEQGWQFAVDTYRDWALLDLRADVTLDAALMTLVHVRNAMAVNHAWRPGTNTASTLVHTMLRIFADERLRSI